MPRKPKRDRAVSSAPPGESTLAVSPKKQQWENLSSEHQWLLKQIKRKQTESGNFIEQMRSLALEIWEKGQPFYQEVDAIDSEIHNLFAEILAMKKGKKTGAVKSSCRYTDTPAYWYSPPLTILYGSV